jgi:bacillithiol biosynthesis cysteine-adding enzyme BshC
MRTTVPFRKIPHQTELFLSYVEREPAALAFYAHPPDIEELRRVARSEIRTAVTPRRELARILRRQNESFGNHAAALAHIDVIERDDAVVVATGQQVGLFGGPLYTVYKAFAAIRLAAELRASGIPAAPVFWMDTEDHDLAEVSRHSRIRPDGAPEPADARPILFPDAHDGGARPVGDVRFPDAIQRVVAELFTTLPAARTAAETRDRVEAAYRAGATFTGAFARLLAGLLGPAGLVLFDPHDAETKPLLAPVFRTAIERADEVYASLAARREALTAAGFHAQVHVPEGSTVLFLSADGERRALTRDEGGFSLKGSPRRWSTAELVALAGSAPERFSPNVLLRPIVQDSLFPTAAYVAGPAEVAYFAQVHALYPIFGRPMPVIWPRASFTLIDADAWAEMESSGLEFEDCLAGKHHLVERLIAAGGRSSATAGVKELGTFIESELDELRPAMVAAEASLGAALDTARRKMLHQVGALETKLVHLETRQDRTVVDHAESLLNRCYPNKGLQERQLGIVPVLALRGPEVLERVARAVRIGPFAHELLRLE